MSGNSSFAEAAFVALDSLRSSKLRSFLTLLGIILATTTLIVAAMSGAHGGDYSAVAQADRSPRSAQGWAQAKQLSQTVDPSTPAVQLRQQSLNDALYFALVRCDLPATVRLLNRGADPNALFPIDGPRPPEGCLSKASHFRPALGRWTHSAM